MLSLQPSQTVADTALLCCLLRLWCILSGRAAVCRVLQASGLLPEEGC